MSKKMLIDASVPDETRVVLVGDNGKILDVDFDNVERRQIKSNIYLARVTRVEPSLQAAFVDYGGNRHGFLPFSEIHPDYFQIPIADRERLMEEAREHRESKRRAKEASETDASDTPARGQEKGKERRRNQKRSAASTDGRRRRRPGLASEEAGDDQIDTDNAAGAPVSGGHAPSDQGGERLDLPVYQDNSEQPDIALPLDVEAAPASDAADDTADLSQDRSSATKDSMPLATRPEDLSDSLTAEVVDGQIKENAPEADSATDKGAEKAQASDASSPTETSAEEPNLAEELEQMIEPRGRNRRRPGQKSPRRNKADAKRRSNRASADDETSEAQEQDAASNAKEEVKVAEALEPSEASAINDQADIEDEDDVLAEAYRAGDDQDDDDDDKDDAQDEVRLSHAFLARRYKIQEVIKRRQIMLIQINKEERGNKGAALTTYLSLPGRYCVLMPNTPKGGGISRKISNPRDRRKLKQILEDLNLPTSLSVIVRTAGSKQDKPEIQRDYDYLLRTWDEIRKTTLESTAPALIYEEGNIIKRAVRDMYTTDCSEIVVEGKRGYDIARKMMGNLMPDQLDKVRMHDDSRQSVMQVHGVEAKLEELHKPSVSLKSGGYLVINQTEALVAIDINSGKATRERSIEDTALKTNLEAAEEIARQLRLRQMAGLVVIDFIDMEERKHNRQVEKRLRDALASDRARIQVGQISSFGLLELSRQRLGPSLHEIYRSTCEHCGGLGHVRGSSAVVRAILRSLESAMRQQDDGESIALTCSTRLGMDLLNNYRRQLGELEERYGLRIEVRLNSDFHAEDFTIEGSEPSGKPRRRNDDQDSSDERRSRTSRSKDERRGKGRSEARDDEDELEDSDDEDEDSKARRRRGRRGGRKRRRSDEDGDLETAEIADDRSDDNDEETDSKGRAARNGRRGRNQRNGRRRDERRVFFARSFDELLNTDREPRDRRQRNQERGRRKTAEQAEAPAFAESFDALLNTDHDLRQRRSRNDRRQRGRDERKKTDTPAAGATEPQLSAEITSTETGPELEAKATSQAQSAGKRESDSKAPDSNAPDTKAPETQASETQASTAQASVASTDNGMEAAPQADGSEAQVEAEQEAATPAPSHAAPESEQKPNEDTPPKPKRKGWWSLGR